MKTFRIHSTINIGIDSQNVTTILRAKNEAHAKEITKGYLEAKGHKVVTQWRGV